MSAPRAPKNPRDSRAEPTRGPASSELAAQAGPGSPARQDPSKHDRRGPQGKQAEQGRPGKEGRPGSDNRRGKQNKADQPGKPGRPGKPLPVSTPTIGEPERSGAVALIGRPNVGKSTLLNAALEHALSIVSPMPGTTRDAILGVVRHLAAEIELLDTPGLHKPKSELGRAMNDAAREAARAADLVVFVAEVGQPKVGVIPSSVHPGDATLLAELALDKPTILVLNKVDRAKDKSALFPLIDAYAKIRSFVAVVPISALKPSAPRRVLDEIAVRLPLRPFKHGPDDLTDRPVRFFAAEYVREQILRATEAEVPHAVAVAIDRFIEPAEGSGGAVHVDATITVERPGQKRILIGTAGAMLKVIGTKARLRIEELTGTKVNLKIWVRVEPAWRQSRAKLTELGYGGSSAATAEASPVVDHADDAEDTDDAEGADDAENDADEDVQ